MFPYKPINGTNSSVYYVSGTADKFTPSSFVASKLTPLNYSAAFSVSTYIPPKTLSFYKILPPIKYIPTNPHLWNPPQNPSVIPTTPTPATTLAPGGTHPAGGGTTAPNVSSIKQKWLNVPYATRSSAEKLDIYLPNEGEGPFPVIVSIHGGAFIMGDKADGQLTPMLQGVNRGYAVVSINYRLSSEATFPAQINDVKAAIRFIRAHAAEYKLNPDKIAVWGGSAGGNLAALAGTSGDVASLEDMDLGNSGQSSRVQAVVDWFGPINFTSMDEQFTASGLGPATHNAADSPESKLFGKAITAVPDLVMGANPETYITADDPAYFIQHGTADSQVPTEQSINFAAKLAKVIGSDNVTLELLQGAGHGDAMFTTTDNVGKVLAFLDKKLKNN
ncbi:MAG: alpha/beta hydrolase [Methanomicrobiales archaeon]|nr:alpha/beta hydrolase [Methanomicrobiales archaeon]